MVSIIIPLITETIIIVIIAINISKLDVIYTKTYYPSTQGIPDYLEVKCKDKENHKEF